MRSLFQNLMIAAWISVTFGAAAQDVTLTSSSAETSTQPHPTISASAPKSGWLVRLPQTDPVIFRGIVSLDSAGVDQPPMFYPAPNAVGLIAAIVTHGLITESAKNSQKIGIQENANKVLAPYREALSTYTHAELLRDLVSVRSTTLDPGSVWEISSTPAFAMTQDQVALTLENAVEIRIAGSNNLPIYSSVIKVVSQPIAESNPAAYWNQDKSKPLRQVSAALFQESIQLAVTMAEGVLNRNVGPQRTFRYLEGKAEKVERASLLAEGCSRRTLLTLRNTVLSIPTSEAIAPTDRCDVTANSKRVVGQ